MPTKPSRMSPLSELLLGIALILVAVVLIWGAAGYAAMGVIAWIGVLLCIHAGWRSVRRGGRGRKTGPGMMAILLLCGGLWLSHPAVSHAATLGSVHGGGQWNQPVGKCRTGSGWTEGTYPSLNLDIGSWVLSWRKTYNFSMGIKFCWKTTDPLGLNRVFRYVHILHPSFSNVDSTIIQNPRYDRTEQVWDPDMPNCLNVRVKGLATLTPIPIPGLDKIFPIISTATIHFWVDFHDVCTDGSVGDVKPDDFPY